MLQKILSSTVLAWSLNHLHVVELFIKLVGTVQNLRFCPVTLLRFWPTKLFMTETSLLGEDTKPLKKAGNLRRDQSRCKNMSACPLFPFCVLSASILLLFCFTSFFLLLWFCLAFVSAWLLYLCGFRFHIRFFFCFCYNFFSVFSSALVHLWFCFSSASFSCASVAWLVLGCVPLWFHFGSASVLL